MELADVEGATLTTLRACCERLGFANLVTAGDEAAPQRSGGGGGGGGGGDATRVDMLRALGDLYDVEAHSHPLDDDPTMAALSRCMAKIASLDERRDECEKVRAAARRQRAPLIHVL